MSYCIISLCSLEIKCVRRLVNTVMIHSSMYQYTTVLGCLQCMLGGGGKCESFQGANQFLKGEWRHEARYKMPPTLAPATLDLAIFHYVTTCIHAIEVL